MKTIEAPNGEIIYVPTYKILIFGLDDTQKQIVEKNISLKDSLIFVV